MNPKIKKHLIPNLPFIFAFWFFGKVGQAYRIAPGSEIGEKILQIANTLGMAMKNPFFSLYPFDLLIGLIGAGFLFAYFRMNGKKKFRKDVEYGSACWGTQKDIAPYADPNPKNNIILTQTESMTMNPRPPSPKHARNKNVLIIGGSGSGKTRFWLKPNLMQCQSKNYPVSFVVTDPKGSIE